MPWPGGVQSPQGGFNSLRTDAWQGQLLQDQSRVRRPVLRRRLLERWYIYKMPRPGGEADKFGNRYEGLWVVDAALDLIDGEFVDLVVEAVGDEAAGVEFFRTNSSGTRE